MGKKDAEIENTIDYKGENARNNNAKAFINICIENDLGTANSFL